MSKGRIKYDEPTPWWDGEFPLFLGFVIGIAALVADAMLRN